MNVYYSYNQKKMCFVLRDGRGGVRDCSSPFIDSKTKAQSGKDVHSLTRSFIHLFNLKCFWKPPWSQTQF